MFEKWIGRHVVVRTYSAGVHLGVLAEVEANAAGINVVLAGARRLWKWDGAFTLSEVATEGVNPKKSRIATLVPEILLTQVVELIPTSEKARGTFDASHE